MSGSIWYLKRCELFARLSPDEAARLEQRSQIKHFARKGLIYLPNDRSDSVLLLAKGRVKIVNITPEGKQSILALIEPGEVFGELAVFAGGEREEFAEAMEPSTVVLLPADEVRRLIDLYPHLALGVTKLMGLRRRRIERRLKHLLFRSNRERLVHLLLELAEQYGCRGPDGVELTIKLSHHDLASIIGSTRESVTLVLGELAHEGILDVGRRKLLITSLQKLAECVDVAPPEVCPCR